MRYNPIIWRCTHCLPHPAVTCLPSTSRIRRARRRTTTAWRSPDSALGAGGMSRTGIRFALLCDIRPNRAVQEGPLRVRQPTVARAAEYVRTAEVMARHRREMLNQVYLPLAGVVLLIVVVMAGIAIAFSPDKIGTVAAFMSLLILVPAVLVCLVPYMLFVALAFGVNWLNRWLPRRL